MLWTALYSQTNWVDLPSSMWLGFSTWMSSLSTSVLLGGTPGETPACGAAPCCVLAFSDQDRAAEDEERTFQKSALSLENESESEGPDWAFLGFFPPGLLTYFSLRGERASGLLLMRRSSLFSFPVSSVATASCQVQ